MASSRTQESKPRSTISYPLIPIYQLEERQMVNAFIQLFLIHRASWNENIRPLVINPGNLLWDSGRQTAVLCDLDVGAENECDLRQSPERRPFIALDLLSPDGLDGKIKRLYQHDAEAFAWSFAYICLNHTTDGNKIIVNPKHPLAAWFSDINNIFSSKRNTLMESWDKMGVPAYPRAQSLARTLVAYYLVRFNDQETKALMNALNAGSTPLPYTELRGGEHFCDNLKCITSWLSQQSGSVKLTENVDALHYKAIYNQISQDEAVKLLSQ